MTADLTRRFFITGATTLAAGFAHLNLPVSAAAHSHANSASEIASAIASLPAETGRSEFLAAVTRGDLAAVQRLAAEDAALIYDRDSDGQSAYLLAAYAGKHDVMAFLESKGIVLDVYEAAAAGKLDRFSQFVKMAPGIVNIPNTAGDAPLQVAALCGQGAVVESGFNYATDWKIANPKRKNANVGHLGAAAPNSDAAEAISFAVFGNGLDPNLLTSDGETALHFAARAGYPRVIRLLLEKGAAADRANSAGHTALDIATSAGHSEAAAVLRAENSIPRDYYARRYAYDPKFGQLKRDDLNGLPLEFVTQFTTVCHFGFDRVKSWLALAPEILNTRAPWDELPVEAAAHMGRADIGAHLLDRGASYSICTATVFGSVDDIKRMLAEDPQRIHERGAHSFPLLWYTAFGSPKLEAAQYLVSHGADPKEDMRGRTVLHIAAASGNADLCRFYLEQGLNPLQKGTNFQGTADAIDVAEKSKHPEIAAMFREWAKSHPA